MTSVSMNNENVNYHILINEALTNQNREAISQVAAKYGNDIHFYSVPDNIVSLFPIGRKNMRAYVSASTYNRLFITELLPESVHRLIYLDGDMIVRKSLSPLWNTDMEGFALGAVHDMDEQYHIDYMKLPYPMKEYGYFNAGMLLINLDYWREHNCMQRFIDFAAANKDIIICHDQDVLNGVLYGEKKWVPVSFNFQHGFLYDIDSVKRYVPEIANEILNVEKDPVVIHYCADYKPWHYFCQHPQRFVWDYYKRKSLWKTYKPDVADLTLREKMSIFVRKNNFWFFEHELDSIHRNVYRRCILLR